MSIFPKRWMGRGIPTDNIPKHYFKDGNIYETKTNKQVKSKKMKDLKQLSVKQVRAYNAFLTKPKVRKNLKNF